MSDELDEALRELAELRDENDRLREAYRFINILCIYIYSPSLSPFFFFSPLIFPGAFFLFYFLVSTLSSS